MNSQVDFANHGWYEWNCSMVAFKPTAYKVNMLNKAIEDAPRWVKEHTKEKMRKHIENVQRQSYGRR